MRRRIAIALVCMLAIIPTMSWGQSASAAAGELVFANTTDISTMDPRNATGTPTAGILAHVYSSLLKTDETGKILPDLAVSYKNINPLTWEFTLNKNIKFHDGSTLTSADVKYTVDTISDPSKKFRLASDFSFMSVEIIDDLHLRITTKQPFLELPLRLNYMKIIPKAYVEKVGDDEFAKKPVGSGPYTFIERSKDEKVVLQAFTGYFGKKPAIKKVTYRIIPEAASRIAALESGEVQIIGTVATSQVPRLKGMKNIEVVGSPTTRVMFIGMNLKKANSPLQDVRVRQALNYGVDKDALISGILDGYGTKIASVSTPEYFGYDPAIKPYEYDQKKAKDLLKAAGYQKGIDLTFSVSSGGLNAYDVVQAISAQLGEIGINCTIVEESNTQQTDKIRAGTVSDLYFTGIGGPYANIDLVTKLSFCTGERFSCYSDKVFDDLRVKAASTVDISEAKKLLSEIQRYMKDKAPAIFLYQQYGLYAYDKRVTNWKARTDEMILANDAEIKK